MFKKKNKSRKILPVEYPILTAYPHIAGIQAMLGNNPYTLPLVMSELTELTYDREIERLDFSLALEIEHYMNNYPLVYSHGLSRSFVEMKWDNAVSFYKDVVNEGYYAIMLVDTYYVSAYRDTYGKQHYFHDMMIYGYDEAKEVFYVADCFVNGKYEFSTSTFDEIEASFIHTYRNDWINGIRLFKLREEPYIGIGYNTEYILEGCRRYLAGAKSNVATYTEERRRYDIKDRFVDGIGIYDELAEYIDDWCENDGWKTYDIRLFYVLYDHGRLFRYMTKQLMQRNQMINAPEIYDRFLDIENRIRNLYMQVLKYNVTGNEKTRNDIRDRLLDIKDREIVAVQSFADSINVTKEDIEVERRRLVREEVVFADSLFMEYDDENHWKKKKLDDRTMYTDVSGAYAKTIFYGSGVNITIIKKSSLGQADVYVDGEKKCTIDYTNGEGRSNVEILDLEPGYHLIKLVNISDDGKSVNICRIKAINAEGEVVSECRLLDCKKGKGGNLIMYCEATGYDIVGYKRKLPEYLTNVHYTVHNAITVLLINDNADRRGVKKSVDSEARIAAYQLCDTEFWLEMTIPGKAREVSFYCSDYDNLDRKQEIFVEDADAGKVLYSQVIESFNEGVLLQFMLRGHVNVRFKRVEGPDAVLNAVWFG